MFNFFSELKTKCNLQTKFGATYNIINIDGQIVYVEGHKGILTLSSEKISCKLKTGFFVITGTSMFIKELTPDTVLVQGKIQKIEVF